MFILFIDKYMKRLEEIESEYKKLLEEMTINIEEIKKMMGEHLAKGRKTKKE